jgi:hypothetical protein
MPTARAEKRAHLLYLVASYGRAMTALAELGHRRGQYFGPDGIAEFQKKEEAIISRASRILNDIERLT